MSTPRFRTSNAHLAMYQKLQGFQCTKDYYNSKTDIEKQIAEIDKTSPIHFCNNCSKIKEIINRKDREFKRCLTDTSKPLKLIDVNGDIQRFIGECTTFQECFSKRSARNRQVPLKSTNTDQCEKNRRCNHGKAPAGGVGRKEQQGLATETSKRGSSPRQKSQFTGAQQAEGKDSKQQMLVSQTTMIANALPNPVKTQHGGSESVNNHQSITSTQVKTSTQPLTASGQEITTEVDNHTITPPPSRPDQKSDSGIPEQQINTDEGPIPKKSPDDQSYGNTPGEQDTAENIALGKDLAREAVVTKAPDSEVHAGEGFVQTYPSVANADGLKPLSADTGNVAATRVHAENAHPNTVIMDGNTSLKVNREAVDHGYPRSIVPDIKDLVTERSADSDTIHDNISNGARGDTNISDVNGSGDELRSAEGSCSETTCSTGKGNELSNDQSNIFSKFVDAISNKDHIIQASAPMGIVLVLGLLLKFTPLWRVLTKKNRKKGAGINEELNSVLQEPSIMDDERSIPFSYGAFEYSAFDQNVY